MDTLEKLALSVAALSHRLERLEKVKPESADQAAAQQVARESGLVISRGAEGYHPGDGAHRKVALALRGKGWSFRRIGAVLGITERTAANWCKG